MLRKLHVVRFGVFARYHLVRTVGQHLVTTHPYTTSEFIEAAEKATKEYPNDWIVLYSLADKYADVGRYAEALNLCKRCVELRPRDARCTFALASAYYALTQAKRAGTEKEATAKTLLQSRLTGLDPAHLQGELEKLDLTPEMAAAQAIRWFERTLDLTSDRRSRAHVRECLHVLNRRFPKLASPALSVKLRKKENRKSFWLVVGGIATGLVLCFLVSALLNSPTEYSQVTVTPTTVTARLAGATSTPRSFPTPNPTPFSTKSQLPPVVYIEERRCITWEEANTHIGEYTCVYGIVTHTYDDTNASFVNFDDSRFSFYLVSFDFLLGEADLEGHCLAALGSIGQHQGRSQMEIMYPDTQLYFCD